MLTTVYYFYLARTQSDSKGMSNAMKYFYYKYMCLDQQIIVSQCLQNINKQINTIIANLIINYG